MRRATSTLCTCRRMQSFPSHEPTCRRPGDSRQDTGRCGPVLACVPRLGVDECHWTCGRLTSVWGPSEASRTQHFRPLAIRQWPQLTATPFRRGFFRHRFRTLSQRARLRRIRGSGVQQPVSLPCSMPPPAPSPAPTAPKRNSYFARLAPPLTTPAVASPPAAITPSSLPVYQPLCRTQRKPVIVPLPILPAVAPLPLSRSPLSSFLVVEP